MKYPPCILNPFLNSDDGYFIMFDEFELYNISKEKNLSTPLFDDFLNNESIYNSCVEFWKNMIKVMFPTVEFEQFFNCTEKDGNPIFNFRIKHTQKVVNIIQLQDDDSIKFRTWEKPFDINDEVLDVLHISLELTPNTFTKALETIKNHIS